jgi:hypothetical protein
MNIAKKMTGGSKFAAALVGKMTGRSQEDIQHFAGNKKKKGLLGSLFGGGSDNSQAVEVLGLIYREMVRVEEDKKLENEKKEKEKNDELEEEDKRNAAIIQALSGKKVKTKSKISTSKDKKEKTTDKKKQLPTKKDIKSSTSKVKSVDKSISEIKKSPIDTAEKVGKGAAILGGAAVVGGALTVSSLAQAIGGAEAGGSYNVAFGDVENPKTGQVSNTLKTKLPTAEEFSGKKLTEMTLAEVQKFQQMRNSKQKNTGAVGKYQFVGSTLFGSKDKPGLVQRKGLSMDTKFTSDIQDQLNEMLYQDNVTALKSQGVPITNGNLYMAHYIGAGGTAAVYRAAQKGENVTVAKAITDAGLPDPSTQNKELTEIKVKDFENILQTRLEKKGLKASPEPSIPVKGSQIDEASKVNKDAKKELDMPATQQKNVNTTNVVSPNQINKPEQKEDDRSAYEIKVNKR